jgi:hypothetical protein
LGLAGVFQDATTAATATAVLQDAVTAALATMTPVAGAQMMPRFATSELGMQTAAVTMGLMQAAAAGPLSTEAFPSHLKFWPGSLILKEV